MLTWYDVGMRKVVSAGGIIMDGPCILMVRHAVGFGFPKGHVEPDESVEQAAVREVREEAGIKAEIVYYVGRINRQSTETTGEVVEKDIELFLMRQTGLANNAPEEQVEWIAMDRAIQEMAYDQEREFLQAHAPALLADAGSNNS